MERFEHTRATLAYEMAGTGPPVLFLHNGGTSSTIWRHQVATLANEHTTVAVDLPGFGASPRPHPALDLDEMVEAVAALLDHLGLADVLVVGNCMGSNIATRLDATRPYLVRGLVLVNPLTEATFSAGWLGPLHRLKGVAPVNRVVHAIGGRLRSPRWAAVAALRFQLGDLGVARRVHHDPELVRAAMRRDQQPALLDVLDDMGAYGALDGAEPPAVPVCVIWGAQNRVLSPRAGAVLERTLQPERSIALAGCGHLPMLEAPDEVTDVIVEWSRRCEHATEVRS